MSHHVQGQHAAPLALSATDPKTVRFTHNFDVGEAEKSAVAAVVKKLRKGKGRAVRAPVARRNVSRQKSKVSQPP